MCPCSLIHMIFWRSTLYTTRGEDKLTFLHHAEFNYLLKLFHADSRHCSLADASWLLIVESIESFWLSLCVWKRKGSAVSTNMSAKGRDKDTHIPNF